MVDFYGRFMVYITMFYRFNLFSNVGGRNLGGLMLVLDVEPYKILGGSSQ